MIAIFKEFNINYEEKIENQTVYLTTDNASNNIKLGKILNVNRIYCFAHFLHNIINQLFESEKFENLYNLVRENIMFFKNNQKNKKILLDNALKLAADNEEINQNFTKLKLDIKVRWNTIIDMIQSLL